MLPEDTQDGPRFGATNGLPVPLAEDLANGLHAMAQPLTILRGALCALTLRGQIAPANHHYLEMSTKQVDRLCELMSSLQGLVDAAQSKPVPEDLELWELMGPLIESHVNVLQQRGVRIETAKPDHAICVFADPARTEQAVNAALKTILESSEPNGLIAIEIVPGDRFVRVTLRSDRARGKRWGSSDRLSLALVDASIRSQNGLCELNEDPLRIEFKLPAKAARNLRSSSADVTSGCFPVAV